jgi:hypothetical protein
MADSREIGLTTYGTLPDWEESSRERSVNHAPQISRKVSNDKATASPVLGTLPLEAHRKDQERRKKAKRDLKEALQSYFATLTRGSDVELTKVTEIVCAYAREIYDSSVEGYRAIPSLDPEALFGEAGLLNVGLTLSDVEKCLSTLRVRRPWKRPGDLLDDGYESMRLYLDEPWLSGEMRDIVAKRVQDSRAAYPLRFPSPPAYAIRKRGRPQTISDAKKTEAAELKASGGTNKQAAAVLYDTKQPSDRQRRNVPAILKHDRQKSKQSGLPSTPGDPPKPRETRG